MNCVVRRGGSGTGASLRTTQVRIFLTFFFKVTEKPLTKEEKIHVLEEKIKSMNDVKITSTMKQSFRGGNIDFKREIPAKEKTTVVDLMPQARRPKAISKAHQHLSNTLGKDYEKEPYQNYLGSK